MTFFFIGLGNPGDEYKNTRHNTGRIMLEHFRLAHEFPEWQKKMAADKKSIALISKGKIGSQTVTLVCPETFMNKSGVSAKAFVTSVKGAERMMVVYDDLDLPFGSSKISFNKSSGGHKGLESIIKALKTEAFPRIRIGISPTTPSGKLKKPVGEDAVTKLILGPFKPDELTALKKLSKRVNEALELFVTSDREVAMTNFN
jgi:PTH1 family peptidyl-tRNA hydrolase